MGELMIVRARENADRIVASEERLGLKLEPNVQRALLRYPRLVHGLNVGYGLFNVTFTVGWLVLLFRRRDGGYHRVRRTCLLTYVGAQPVFEGKGNGFSTIRSIQPSV